MTEEKKKKKKSGGVLMWVIFILTLPVWLPVWLISTAVFIVFGIISTVWGFILSIPFRVL
jgi:hypothetical protein